MPFSATGLEVLISSPSDTAASRKAVTDAVTEWNDLNAVPFGVVLLPRLWEISAVGGLGAGPQDLLNKQLVDNADIVIAMLWTRLGTPTSGAASGTVEEINRARARGTDVLLYFSDAPVQLGTVNLEQLKAVLEFKETMKAEGLFATYDTDSVLKARVQRDLTRLVRLRADAGLLAVVQRQSQADEADGMPEPLREAFDAYRSELRGLVAQVRMQWGPQQAANDSDGIRHLAGAAAEEISKYLAAIAGLGEDQSSSLLYDELLRLGQSSAALSRMQMYMDGGRSWNALNKGLEEVLAGLLALAGQDWIELLHRRAEAPDTLQPPDAQEDPSVSATAEMAHYVKHLKERGPCGDGETEQVGLETGAGSLHPTGSRGGNHSRIRLRAELRGSVAHK